MYKWPTGYLSVILDHRGYKRLLIFLTCCYLCLFDSRWVIYAFWQRQRLDLTMRIEQQVHMRYNACAAAVVWLSIRAAKHNTWFIAGVGRSPVHKLNSVEGRQPCDLQTTRRNKCHELFSYWQDRGYVTARDSVCCPAILYLHCALAAAQCIVIGPVCLWVCLWVCLFVCLWVCYHDNSKLRASILTKLCL